MEVLPLDDFFGVGDGGEFILLFKVEGLVLGEGVIGKENAFEVVVFVENDAGLEGFENFGELATVFIYGLDLDFVGTENGTIEVGDGEATFEIRFVGVFAKSEVVRLVKNFRVEVEVGAIMEPSDEKTNIVAYLRGGNGDAFGILGIDQGFFEILEELLDFRGDFIDGSGFFSEGWVRNGNNG